MPWKVRKLPDFRKPQPDFPPALPGAFRYSFLPPLFSRLFSCFSPPPSPPSTTTGSTAPAPGAPSAPAGQNWTVKAVIGLYDAASPPAPGALIPLVTGQPLPYAGGGMYELLALRRTDKGYWVQLTNGTTDKDVMVGNAAW
ncbi:MAG: hypothetical protein IPH12_14480 [Saprospirales bacterium]|nr:hypothetical protein [Saprospirales bacterium]MBK8924019.1 hypothetical protein [Saprospirales bacterium]